MKVMIIGANGFIGSHTAAAAAEHGADLILVGTGSERWRLDALGVDNEVSLLDDVDPAAVDVIFVSSGSSSPSLLNAADATRIGRETAIHQRLLERVLATDSRPLIVLSGSRTQYGRPDRLPVSERAPLRPQSSYAAEKSFVEQMYAFAARDVGLASVRLRLTNPYGPYEWTEGRRHGLVSIFAQQAADNGAISVYGDGLDVRDYVHVHDVAALVVAILEQRSTGSIPINVGSGTGHTLRDVAEAVAASLPGIEVNSVPAPAGSSAIESGDFIADISRAAKLFDWAPMIDFETGMKEAARFEADRIRAARRTQK